jgi:hypothetical protein
MEKLVLRGIMYGADKIPDSWFEKVPGGFYKEKEKEKERKQHQKDEKRRSQSHRCDRSRRRRHSDEYEDSRRRRHDEDVDREDRAGYATERRRRHERSRSSYDGGADYDSDGSERARRRARRRTYDDNERYGYDDGFSRPNGARHSYAPPTGSHRPSQYPDPNVNSASKRASAAAAAASAGTAAALAQQAQRHAAVASPPIVPVAAPVPGSVPVSYIPYANIYGAGSPYQQGAPNAFSPPPAASISPVQPNIVPGAPLVNPYSPVNAAVQSQRRDSYIPSHSHSPSSDGGAVPPRRTRSERRPHHAHEKSHSK